MILLWFSTEDHVTSIPVTFSQFSHATMDQQNNTDGIFTHWVMRAFDQNRGFFNICSGWLIWYSMEKKKFIKAVMCRLYCMFGNSIKPFLEKLKVRNWKKNPESNQSSKIRKEDVEDLTNRTRVKTTIQDCRGVATLSAKWEMTPNMLLLAQSYCLWRLHLEVGGS